MRRILVALLAAHGLLHLLGVAHAFGLVPIEGLTRPIPPALGVVWLAAGAAFVAAGWLLGRGSRLWWLVAGSAAALSQPVVVAAWPDAAFGTVPNVLILAAVVHAAASTGPWGLRARYRRAVEEATTGTPPSAPAPPGRSRLPEPVRRYLRASGWEGRPRPAWFRARWRGRIRGGPDEPWMEFTAEQLNVVDGPGRFFFMDARRAGLPVDVFHAYRSGTASMDVRLLSLLPLVRARGPELDRAETVTVLNDMAVLAPGCLGDPAIEWEEVDGSAARARYTVAGRTVSALLRFDGDGRLVDFISDDRGAADGDGGFVPMRWSTPLSGYRPFGDRWAPGGGRALWHPEGGAPWAYFEGELLEVEAGPATAEVTTAGR